MGRCRECRTHVWFRKLCPQCEARLAWLEREGYSRVEGGRHFHKTDIRESTHTSIRIVINGKRLDVPALEALTPQLLERLSAEVEVPVSELTPLLQQTFEQAGATDALPIDVASPAAGPLRRVQCPGCERTVPARKGWCVYCGHDLATPSTTTRNAAEAELEDVDRQVLHTDVRPSGTSDEHEEQQQQVRDSFRDRLEGL